MDSTDPFRVWIRAAVAYSALVQQSKFHQAWACKNNQLLLFLQQKQNIEPQLMPVRKLYGFDRSFQSLDYSNNNLLHFGAIIKVPSNSPNIQFYINTTNTLSYICTSSEVLFMIMFLKCSIALQMIKLQTSSPSLLQKRSFLNFSLCQEFRNVSS